MSQSYDAIIIGSGIGGLTCGAFLARSGMKVCVLEQHDKIGGYAHSFKRGKYNFESSIHSVPMSDDGVIYHLLRILGIDDTIETIELPEMCRFDSPEFSFSIPSKKDDILYALYDNFPNEKQNLNLLFKEANKIYSVMTEPFFTYKYDFEEKKRNFVSQYRNLSYKSYIDSIISDERLKNIFYSLWLCAGTSPDYGSALFHFMMFVVHLMDGSHYCKTGFSSFANALSSVIIENGGEIKTCSRVTEIVTDGRKIRSVKIEKGEEFEADIFVSNISPYLIHNELLYEKSRSKRWIRRLNNLQPSVSAVAVYLGMKPEVGEIVPAGVSSWFSSLDYKQIFDNVMNNRKNEIDHLLFLRPPENSDNSTLMLLNLTKKSYSGNWKDDKLRIAERMLLQAEKLYPGINDMIEVGETASPFTFERFTGNTDGALFGFENIKELYGEAKMPFKIHLSNYYRTGHWGRSGGGVWNVMVNGYTASKIILKDLE